MNRGGVATLWMVRLLIDMTLVPWYNSRVLVRPWPYQRVGYSETRFKTGAFRGFGYSISLDVDDKDVGSYKGDTRRFKDRRRVWVNRVVFLVRRVFCQGSEAEYTTG
jgi:hypothetical protein